MKINLFRTMKIVLVTLNHREAVYSASNWEETLVPRNTKKLTPISSMTMIIQEAN